MSRMRQAVGSWVLLVTRGRKGLGECSGLIDSTNTGGLISFFYNSYTDTLPDGMSARAEVTLPRGPVPGLARRLSALEDKAPLELPPGASLKSIKWPMP